MDAMLLTPDPVVEAYTRLAVLNPAYHNAVPSRSFEYMRLEREVRALTKFVDEAPARSLRGLQLQILEVVETIDDTVDFNEWAADRLRRMAMRLDLDPPAY